MDKILNEEQYRIAMDKLDLLYCVEDRDDDEDMELLLLSRLTEEWELSQGI